MSIEANVEAPETFTDVAVKAPPTFKSLDTVALVADNVVMVPVVELIVATVPTPEIARFVAPISPNPKKDVGSLALSKLPEVILSAVIAVIPKPDPTNDAAVIMPVVLIFPRAESIPTPK